ncbi:hypothetical protein HDE_03589 [Halotydeus destructor]|nr:hypothetical protein HDE_03589 [Halotydeus destructor]
MATIDMALRYSGDVVRKDNISVDCHSKCFRPDCQEAFYTTEWFSIQDVVPNQVNSTLKVRQGKSLLIEYQLKYGLEVFIMDIFTIIGICYEASIHSFSTQGLAMVKLSDQRTKLAEYAVVAVCVIATTSHSLYITLLYSSYPVSTESYLGKPVKKVYPNLSICQAGGNPRIELLNGSAAVISGYFASRRPKQVPYPASRSVRYYSVWYGDCWSLWPDSGTYLDSDKPLYSIDVKYANSPRMTLEFDGFFLKEPEQLNSPCSIGYDYSVMEYLPAPYRSQCVVYSDATSHGKSNLNRKCLQRQALTKNCSSCEPTLQEGEYVGCCPEKIKTDLQLICDQIYRHIECTEKRITEMASVNGEDVHPSGMMAVDIAVFDGDRELVLRTNVLVLDKLNCDLLLGNNFNKKANLIVDCDSGSISFKQKNNKKGIRVCHLTTMSSDYLDALKIIEAQRAQDEDDLPSHPRNIFMMTGDIPDMPLLGPNLEDLLGPWIPLSREDSDLGLGQSPPQTPEPSDAVASVEMDGEHLKSSSTGTSKEPKKMVHFPLKAKSNSLLPPFASDIITVELCGMQPREKTRYRLCADSWNLQVDDEFITFIGSEGFVIFKNLTSDTYPISQGDKVAFLELEDPVQEKVEGRDYWTLYPKHHYRIRKQAELKLPAVISCPHTLDNIEYFRLLSCEPRINIKQQYIKVRNQQIELLDINNVCTRDFVLLSTFALARAERVSSAEVEALLDESWQDPAQFLEMHLNTASPEVKPTNSKKKRVTRANTKMPTKLTAMTDIILFPGISVSLDVKANYAVKGTGILEIPQQDIAGILEVPMQQVTFNKKFGNVEIKNACKDIVYIIKDKFYINMDQGVNLKMLAAVQPESEPKNLPAEPSTSSEKSEINMFGTRDSGNELEFTKIQSKLPMIGKIPFIVAQDDTKNGNSQVREEKEHMELFEGKRRSGFSPLLAMNNVILPPFGSEVIRVKVGGILPTMYKENSIIARNPRLQPRSNVITFIYNKADVVFHNFSKEQIRIYPNAVVAFTVIDDLVLEQVEGRDYWELIVDIPTKLPKRSKIQLPVKLSSSDSLNTVEMMRIFESREEVNIPEDHLQIRNRQIDFINVENTTNKTIKWRPGTVVARVSRCDCPSSVNREAQDFDLAPPAYEAVSDKFTIAMFNTVRGGLRPGTPRPAAFDFVSSTSQRKHLFTVNSAMIPAQTETRLDVEAIGFLPDNRYRYRTMKMDDVLDVRTKYVSFLDRKTSVVVHNSSDKDKVISPGYLISAVELEYSSIVISLYKPVRAMDNIVIRPDESATLKIEIAENPPIRKTNYYQLRPVSEQFNFQKTMIPIEENEDHYLRIKNTARENLRLLKGEVVAEARRLSPQEVKAFPLAIFTMADEIPTKDGKPSKVSQRSESQSTDVDHSHLEDIGFIQIFRARIVRPTSDRDRLKTVGKEEPVDRIYQKRKQIGMFGPRRQKTTPREQLRELNPHELLEFLKESHPDYDHQNTHNYTEIVFEHDTQQGVHEKERPAGIFQNDANQGIPANEIKQKDANTTNRVVKHVVKINSAWSIYSGLLIVLLIFLMFLRLTEAMNFDEHLTRIHKQQTVKEDSKQFWMKMLMCIGFSAIALALCLKVYRVLKVATNFSDEPSLRASGDIPSPALTVGGIRKQQQYLMNLTEAEKQKSGFLPIVDTFNSSTLGSGSVQISKQLERDEQKRIEHLLDSYFDVFAFDDTEIGYCSVLNHEIDTGDHAPVFIKPRSSRQSSTKFSPYYLMFGRELLTPIEILFDVPKNGVKHPATYREMLQNHMHGILKVAKANIEKAQQVTASRYNSSHTPVEYQEGEKVLIRFPTRKVGLAEKLGHPWRGPFVIIKKMTPLVYEVQLLTGNKRKKTSVHISRMKPYYDREESDSSESETESDRIPLITTAGTQVNQSPVTSQSSRQPESVLRDDHEASRCNPSRNASDDNSRANPVDAPARSPEVADVRDIRRGKDSSEDVNTEIEQRDDNRDDNVSTVNVRGSQVDLSPRVHATAQRPELLKDSSSLEESSSDTSDYRTPATRTVEKTLKIGNSQTVPGTNAVTPRRSTRTKKPSSKYQALFFLLFLVSVSQSSFTRDSQVVWVPSHEKTITGMQSIVALVKIEDPCDIFRTLPHSIYPVEVKRQYIEYCEDVFREDVIKPLMKFCPDIDAEATSTNSIRLHRPKRVVVTAAIVIGVVIALGVTTLASYLSISSTSDLKQQVSLMEKKLAEASKNLELSHKIIEKIEHSIEALTKVVQENRDNIQRIESSMPYANIITSHLSAQLRDVKTKLTASARAWKTKRIDHVLLETLNITLPCDDDCPLSLATPKSCILNSRKKTVQLSFEVTKTDPNVTILKADPFKMISYNGNQVCLKTYAGPQALLINRQDDCIHPIAEKAFSSPGFIASTGPVPCMTPDFTGSADRFWVKQGCDSRASMSPLDHIQIKRNGRDIHLLCPEMPILIHGTSATCPDYVFSLPYSVPFEVGSFKYRAQTALIDTQMQLESDWIHKINFIMDPPKRPIDIQVNETKELLESWTTDSSYSLDIPTPSFHVTPWLLIVLVGIWALWRLSYRRGRRHKDQMQPVELDEVVQEIIPAKTRRNRRNSAVTDSQQAESQV